MQSKRTSEKVDTHKKWEEQNMFIKIDSRSKKGLGEKTFIQLKERLNVADMYISLNFLY